MDGSSIDDVDVVLFATGYDFSFPFLPNSNVKISNRRIQGLYQHVFSINDPGLAFIGMVSDISQSKEREQRSQKKAGLTRIFY